MFATILGLYKYSYVKEFTDAVNEMEPFEIRITVLDEKNDPLFFQPNQKPILALGYVHKAANEVDSFFPQLN